MTTMDLQHAWRRAVPAVLLCACAALAVAGCGSSSGGSSSASGGSASSAAKSGGVDQACSILTKSIARSLFGGGSVTRTRKAQPNPHMTQCVYNGGKSGSIAVLTGEWSFIKEFAAAGAQTKIAGLGDEAYKTSSGVIARRGDQGVSVTAFKESGTFSGAAATNANASALAFEKKIARRLVPLL